MGLIEFSYGSVASSKDVNSNFKYLENEIVNLSQTLSNNMDSIAQSVTSIYTAIDIINGYRSSFIDVGMIIPSVQSDIPEDFLLCDGSVLLREEFPELFRVIGTNFGSDDSANFYLPDLVNKTLWGADSENYLSYLTSKLPNIKGQFRLAGTEGASAVSGAFASGKKGGSWGHGHDRSSSNPLMTFDASTYNEIYSDDCNIVQPPALALNFIIKFRTGGEE